MECCGKGAGWAFVIFLGLDEGGAEEGRRIIKYEIARMEFVE